MYIQLIMQKRQHDRLQFWGTLFFFNIFLIIPIFPILFNYSVVTWSGDILTIFLALHFMI